MTDIDALARRIADDLPTFEQCGALVKAGSTCALVHFIYQTEPVGSAEIDFRDGLVAVLAETHTAGRSEGFAAGAQAEEERCLN